MSELESIHRKKEKRHGKPAAKRQRVLKVLGAGAAAAAVGVAFRRKLAGSSRIVVPEDHGATAESKVDASARRKLQLVLADSLSADQAATLLALTFTAVTRRIRARSLYAIPSAGKWFVPKFQFRGNALIRGMEEILPRLNEKLHPLEVINWFSLRHVDLVMSGKPVSPATWLESGGDIARVAALAAELGSGV